MIFNMTGGGVNPLNFQVKTYPSETALKADNPKENTIGVITTTNMTSWVFSATELKEPEVGMVWIKVGTSSPAEFNAIKKNTLQVYPLTAKQYEGGKWAVKVAYIYQNGEWVDLARYLYDNGNEYADITGGWTNEGYTHNGSSIGGPTNANGQLVFDAKDGKHYGGGGTKNKIDISGFSTLHVIGNVNTEMTWVLIGVYSAKELKSPVASTRRDNAIGAAYDLTVDISNVPPGSYYIGGVFNGSVTKVVLE